MRVRQVLTVAALAGLQFAPMPIALSIRSSFSDTVSAQTGDIVGVRLQNTGATTETAGYITFGQVFLAGAVKPTDSLVARLNGLKAAVQMDGKATHADGSVRHAILTLRAPAIAAGGSVDLMLAKGTATPPVPAAPTVTALLASGYDMTVNFTNGMTASASAAAALRATLSAGTIQNWLAGPEVNEYDVSASVNGGKLKVRFNIRAYADGTTTTDVIFDNSWMFSPGKTDLNYDVSISQKGARVFSASGVSQYLYSTWHHQVDSPGMINPNIQFDVPNLLAAGALPNYDLTFGVSDAAIQANFAALDATNTGPMGTAMVTTYMPSTGGRQDIGPQPNWTAHWLLSQDATARAVMMANADASGSVPWHLTDENTDKPVNRETYPTFMDLPGLAASDGYLVPANGWPTYGGSGDPWTADAAHMPDLTYVPYLTTGSHYLFDQMQAQAAFAIFQTHPYYDYYTADGIDPLNPGTALYAGLALGQVREIAWSIRQVAEAAYITPDSDPLKSYFTSQLNATMHGLVQHYVTDAADAAFGRIKGFITGGGTATACDATYVAPWMQGYLVTALAVVAKTGILPAADAAVRVMGYMAPFIAGLYTNGSYGYNPFNGPAYTLYICDPTTLTPYTSWAQLHSENVRLFLLNDGGWGIPSANPTAFPDDALDMDSGYPIIARAALADLITHTRSPAATQAYNYLVNQITNVWSTNGGSQAEIAAWQVDPAWNVR